MTIPAIPSPGVRMTANQAEAYMHASIPRGSIDIHAYGHSYTVRNVAWHTTGEHWLDLLKAEINGGTLTSYGVSGSRIDKVAGGLLSEGLLAGIGGTAPVAGSTFPGTSGRTGLGILDITFNDVAHYPDMSAVVAVPAAITTANTQYVDGMKGMYRLALALMSSETRHETASGTLGNTGGGGGSWTLSGGQAYASGDAIAFTTTANDYWEKSVTPPQTGPLAGKVFIVSYKAKAASGTMAQITTTIDGGSSATYTPTAWEAYLGWAGASVDVVYDCFALTLPVDNAAHTVRMRHTGSAGHLMYHDCLIIPSEDPNPILVMDAGPPNSHASYWSSTNVAVWKQNYALLTPSLRSVVAEFPNAIWVPSTMTSNGHYTGDGLHPNDRGMRQRAGDAAVALRDVLARLRSRALQLEPNASFGVN